jgi:hypothetical protein
MGSAGVMASKQSKAKQSKAKQSKQVMQTIERFQQG